MTFRPSPRKYDYIVVGWKMKLHQPSTAPWFTFRRIRADGIILYTTFRPCFYVEMPVSDINIEQNLFATDIREGNESSSSVYKDIVCLSVGFFF